MTYPTFEDRYLDIIKEIEKRRAGWTYTKLSFEDVSQILLIRIHNKYHLYDPERPFPNWVNKLISNGIRNILRDKFLKFSRPCLNGCRFNLGSDGCSFTKSGLQCEECPLFQKWKNKKEDQWRVKQELPISTHENEIFNIQSDTIDIGACKKIIDTKIKAKLEPFEYRIYKMVHIQNKSLKEVGTILKFKKCSNSDIPGYQRLRNVSKKIVVMAKIIIQEENLA